MYLSIQGLPNWGMNCHYHLTFRTHVKPSSAHFTQVQKCLKALQISCDTGCFAKKSRKVSLCHQKRIPFTTTLKGVITKHWYGSGRWRQCKPYQHLLVTDGSYKVKTWKSSTCQGNLLRRNCWSLPFVSARNLDANEVFFALAEQMKCASRKHASVAMSVTILLKFSLISQMMKKIADHSVWHSVLRVCQVIVF